MPPKIALLFKMALLLDYLPKKKFESILDEIQKERQAGYEISEKDLLEKYIGEANYIRLKHNYSLLSSGQTDERFGELCVAFGFLSDKNLNKALKKQKKLKSAGRHLALGTILVKLGLLSKGQRDLIVFKQKKNKKKLVEEACKNKEIFDFSDFKQIDEQGLIILIAHDALHAYLLKTKHFNPVMTIDDIHALLEKNKIIYGVVDDDAMALFIQNPVHTSVPFEVAKGVGAIDDIDGKIIYSFDLDYLKPGLIFKDGSIDFRDRGELPFVKKGDLLAEKIPLKPGKNGINILGDTIHCKSGYAPSFKIGKGVKRSPDHLKIYADTEGTPKVDNLSEISVNDVYFIKGDVDFNTGNIKFNKNIFISGTIKPGFRVEGIDVTVSQVDSASIRAKGNIIIQNGAIESLVEAQGNIKAGYIHRSSILCFGDVRVKKEVVDSQIDADGKFDMPRGRLFSSTITAKAGAIIHKIGTERNRPSTINIGVSSIYEKTIERLEFQIKNNMIKLENMNDQINKTQSELDSLKKQIKGFKKSKQKSQVMMDKMNKKGNKNTGLLMQNIEDADVRITELKARIQMLEENLTKYKQESEICSQFLKDGVQTKLKFKRLSQAHKSMPVLEILGTIMARTKIFGPNSRITIKENVGRSRILEAQIGEQSKNKELLVVPF